MAQFDVQPFPSESFATRNSEARNRSRENRATSYVRLEVDVPGDINSEACEFMTDGD